MIAIILKYLFLPPLNSDKFTSVIYHLSTIIVQELSIKVVDTSQPFNLYRDYFKRIFDLTIIFLFMPLIIPVFIIVFLCLLISPSNIFFIDKRQGYQGRIFDLYKFSTMTKYNPKEHHSPHDKKRITKLGKLLRATSLDELPQILNVIIGNMSLVGPRPLPGSYEKHYSTEHKKRLSVLPGITGLAQVNGRNTISWADRFDYDIMYIANLSFKNDIRIALSTVKTLVRFSNINMDDTVTMTAFEGYE